MELSKYRILKETTSKTRRVIYFIEVKRKFLWWTWWSKEYFYHPLHDTHFETSYKTLAEVRERIKELEDKIIREIV